MPPEVFLDGGGFPGATLVRGEVIPSLEDFVDNAGACAGWEAYGRLGKGLARAVKLVLDFRAEGGGHFHGRGGVVE